MLRLSTKNSGSSSRPLAALILVTAIGLSTTVVGQWTLDQPGARQPVAPSAPRVPPLPEASWTDVQKQLVAKHVPNGRMDNAFKTLLTVPELFDGVMPYTNYLLNESSLTPRQRELLVLRAAWLLGNQALWATHAPIARNLGFTAAEIRRIAEGPDAAGWERV